MSCAFFQLSKSFAIKTSKELLFFMFFVGNKAIMTISTPTPLLSEYSNQEGNSLNHNSLNSTMVLKISLSPTPMVYGSEVLAVLDLKSSMHVVLHLVSCLDTPKFVNDLPDLTVKIQCLETQ
jgi:hypothetical protein